MNLVDKSLLCLGMLLEFMPAEKNVAAYTINFIDDSACSWSPSHRRAACLATAILVDSGRADDQCLNRLFQFVLAGILDPNPAVRNAGLCALNQYLLHSKVSKLFPVFKVMSPFLGASL